jgi:hypothetical protein
VFDDVAVMLAGLGTHCWLVPVGVLTFIDPEASNQYVVAVVVNEGA